MSITKTGWRAWQKSAGLSRYRLIDEPSAAALGYGAHIQPGDVYLIFDFGGGTMHAAVVLVEPQEQENNGRRCRVLGKAGADLGGTTIDQWLFQEVLRRNRRSDTDEDVRLVSTRVAGGVRARSKKRCLPGAKQPSKSNCRKAATLLAS